MNHFTQSEQRPLVVSLGNFKKVPITIIWGVQGGVDKKIFVDNLNEKERSELKQRLGF